MPISAFLFLRLLSHLLLSSPPFTLHSSSSPLPISSLLSHTHNFISSFTHRFIYSSNHCPPSINRDLLDSCVLNTYPTIKVFEELVQPTCVLYVSINRFLLSQCITHISSRCIRCLHSRITLRFLWYSGTTRSLFLTLSYEACLQVCQQLALHLLFTLFHPCTLASHSLSLTLFRPWSRCNIMYSFIQEAIRARYRLSTTQVTPQHTSMLNNCTPPSPFHYSFSLFLLLFLSL